MTLLSTLIFIPHNKTYAAHDVCPVPSTNSVPGYTYVDNNGTVCAWVPNLTPTENITIEEGATPTASLSIDNSASVEDKVNSSYGATSYAGHTVSVNVTGAKSYSLILSGPAKLSGPSTINATTGATGANLANDTWGYAWENTTVTNPNANYKALGSNITLTGNALSNNAASFSKKLSFAAKFDKASAGIYHADVNLSLVVTPSMTTVTANAVPWNKLVYMQDMSEASCKQAKIGDSKTLTDVRDNSTYTIAKLSDGKCWMTQNLRLSRETLKTGLENTITQYDSNTNSNYNIPASTNGAFDLTTKSDGYYTNQQIRASTDNNYGAYYSHNAATLNKVWNQSSGIATYDICPKGWRLPTGGLSGEFQALYNTYTTPIGLTTANGEKGYWFGGANTSAGGAFFPAAGYMANSSNLGSSGTAGTYWSNTIHGPTGAYRLWFSGDGIEPGSSTPRYTGHTIRCVAK